MKLKWANEVKNRPVMKLENANRIIVSILMNSKYTNKIEVKKGSMKLKMGKLI